MRDWSMAFWGDNGNVSNFYIDTVNYDISNDGIHIVAGSNWNVVNGYVHCGDDIMAVANSLNESASDINFTNITGRSEQGMSIKVHNNNTGGSNYLERINFNNIATISGVTRNAMVYIKDNDSNYRCREINISNSIFRTGTTSTVNQDGFFIWDSESVRVTNTIIDTAVRAGIRLLDSRNIHFNKCDINTTQTASYPTIWVDGVDDLSFSHCRVQSPSSAQHNMRLIDATNVRTTGCFFYDILDGFTGISMSKDTAGSDHIVFSGNIFAQDSGATTSHAVNVAAADSVAHVTFVGNDVADLSGDNSGDKIIKGTIRPYTEFTSEENSGNIYTISATGQTFKTYGNVLMDSSGGARTATLPDAVKEGSEVLLAMDTAGNNFVVTVTSHEDGDGGTYTFDAVDEAVLLKWVIDQWTEVVVLGGLAAYVP